MEKTGILIVWLLGARPGRVRLAETRISWGRCMLLGTLLHLLPFNAWSELSSGGLAELTAAEQYRQYNLLVMVAEGMDPAFVDELQSAGPRQLEADENLFPQIKVDDYQTPLNRIVDQNALIANALGVIRFVQANRASILSALDTIAKTQPGAVAEVNLVELAEDAIIVRTALSNALEYRDGGDSDATGEAYLQAYHAKTVYLRNVMEYWAFSEELDSITEDAMDSTGGRMEAYQRLLEDEPAMDSFKQHLDAVENIYWLARNKKGKPPKLPGDELIDSEAKVH
jgi:hypothetical protein